MCKEPFVAYDADEMTYYSSSATNPVVAGTRYAVCQTNVQYGNVKQLSSAGLTLPVTTHFASIYHITALRISNFIPRANDLYLLL